MTCDMSLVKYGMSPSTHLQHLAQSLLRFPGRLLAQARVPAAAQATREVSADLHLVEGCVLSQGLGVGVDSPELHALCKCARCDVSKCHTCFLRDEMLRSVGEQHSHQYCCCASWFVPVGKRSWVRCMSLEPPCSYLQATGNHAVERVATAATNANDLNGSIAANGLIAVIASAVHKHVGLALLLLLQRARPACARRAGEAHSRRGAGQRPGAAGGSCWLLLLLAQGRRAVCLRDWE